MPKLKEPRITVKNKKEEVLAQVTLPLFCLEHMKMGNEGDNLKMMVKHLNSAGKLTIDKLFTTNGELLTGLVWTQCATDLELRVD